jgi:hypothetical protein
MEEEGDRRGLRQRAVPGADREGPPRVPHKGTAPVFEHTCGPSKRARSEG